MMTALRRSLEGPRWSITVLGQPATVAWLQASYPAVEFVAWTAPWPAFVAFLAPPIGR